MSATQQLKDEHEGILLMLRILDKVAAKIEDRGKIDPEHLDRIVEFFQVFADKCHHGKEEDLLFPELEKSGIAREGGPIGVMLAEHQQGRAFVKGMAEGAAQNKKGDAKGLAQFARNAREYITLLRQHIGKENEISFFSIGVPEGQPDAKNILFLLLGQGVIMHFQDEFISSVV